MNSSLTPYEQLLSKGLAEKLTEIDLLEAARKIASKGRNTLIPTRLAADLRLLSEAAQQEAVEIMQEVDYSGKK